MKNKFKTIILFIPIIGLIIPLIEVIRMLYFITFDKYGLYQYYSVTNKYYISSLFVHMMGAIVLLLLTQSNIIL